MVDQTPRDRHGNVLEYISQPALDELRDAKGRAYCSSCTRRLRPTGRAGWWSQRRLWCVECFYAGEPARIEIDHQEARRA